jgi:hypothetical protein
MQSYNKNYYCASVISFLIYQQRTIIIPATSGNYFYDASK